MEERPFMAALAPQKTGALAPVELHSGEAPFPKQLGTGHRQLATVLPVEIFASPASQGRQC